MWECEWEKGRISQAYSLKDLPHYTAFLPTADREPVLKERDGPLARWIRWWVLAANELSWARPRKFWDGEISLKSGHNKTSTSHQCPFPTFTSVITSQSSHYKPVFRGQLGHKAPLSCSLCSIVQITGTHFNLLSRMLFCSFKHKLDMP